MSRNSTKRKKSTSKYRKFKISPLIPVIAIIEVIVLVAISTYAWFVVAQEKEAKTGIITVDADSGLDIDFKNANYNDRINLWDYVPDDFEFTPVTSLDGRNVYIPTSGTFGNTSTNNIVYRDATINDINTKFVVVDFTLTNTNTEDDVQVFLNNRSHFRVYDNRQETNGEEQDNSRALRLAFYTNDAKHGNVSSTILENTINENAALDKMDNRVTVYFDKKDSEWGDNCYAYIWGNDNKPYVSWPGSKMTRVAGTVYSYTFSNKGNYYNKIVFSDGGDTNKTADLPIKANKLYKYNDTASTDQPDYVTKTVYFLKPNGWSGVRAYAFNQSGHSGSFTTSYPGDECTYVGANIYSYTFPETYNSNNVGGITFNNTSNQSQQTVDLDAMDGKLYYYNGTKTSSKYNCGNTNYVVNGKEQTNTVYFYNSVGWKVPYAKINKTTNETSSTRIAMTNLSAGVYYATIPKGVYQTVSFEERDGINNITSAQTGANKYTRTYNITDGQIYRPGAWSSTGYILSDYSYSSYVGGTEGSYAVISPGVSAGFQRPYTPVVGVAANTGAPTQLVPAFASSLDNYIKGANNPMFEIPAGGMLDLSMIVWLEGTDADCTKDSYAAKYIDLYLEFSTNLSSRIVDGVDADASDNYTYRFYDKTRECWTSNRLTNAAGFSVAPVMQLYDGTDKRGYLMHAASTTDYNGVRKVDMWECSAPKSLVQNSHDLYFRRVDPYNEDEVWNYWHPGVVNGIDDAFVVINNKTYVCFTAFADGAPASTTNDRSGIPGNKTVLQAATNASTPATSCGGLWGTYETTLLTVVDNTFNSSTNQHWLNADGGVMTIKYTYNYFTSGKSQTIEYKASGPYRDQLYYFVVPKLLHENVTPKGSSTALTGGSARASSYTFHRFWGFKKDFAMNILERNSSMSYNSTGCATIATQMYNYYAWLGQTNGATSIDQSWFGDLLYVNLSVGTSNGNEDVMANGKYKLGIWGNGINVEEYLYINNDSFQLSGFMGYLAVTPYNWQSGSNMGKRPTNMQLRRCSSNFGTVHNYSNNIPFAAGQHNLIAHKWLSSDRNKIDYIYNDEQGTYGWPVIPSYTE